MRYLQWSHSRRSNRAALLLAAALTIASTSHADAAAATDAAGYEVIANAFGFLVDIPGSPDLSKNVREIEIDDLTIDIRETTTGLDAEDHAGRRSPGYPYRLYVPGAAHWGSATITSACTLGGSKELQAWWREAANGEDARRNITVTLFKRDKTPARSYRLYDVFPTSWYSKQPGTDPSVSRDEPCTEIITVKIGRGEIIAHPATGRGVPGTANGFTSSLTTCEGCVTERDNGWEVAAGGAQQRESHAMTFGRNLDDTVSPLHEARSCGEVRLRGPITTGRKAFVLWINETAQGKPWKRDFTLTELLSVGGSIKDGKQYLYFDGFPVRYVFPRFSVKKDTGNVMEEVRLKFVRCELK